MGKSHILRLVVFGAVFAIAVAGCVSLSHTRSGEKDFWRKTLEKKIPATAVLDTDASWNKFERSMNTWLTGKIGVLRERTARKMFGKPTERRVTESARSAGWYYREGKLFDWDMLVASGNHRNEKDYMLVLGFTPKGALATFELASSRNPSTTIGGTTKYLVRGAVTVGGTILFSQLMEKALNRASDYLAKKLEGLGPELEQRIQNGIKGGLPAELNLKSTKIQGTLSSGESINLTIPKTGLEIPKVP